MKQVLSFFSKNNLIIIIGIILILVSVIGLNYLKNIENLEVKKVNKDKKILKKTCQKDCDSTCAYSAFVNSELRKERGGQPEGYYGDCYISQYSLPNSNKDTEKALVNKGKTPPGKGKRLGECEGDCDSNRDCISGLKCYKRSSKNSVPPGCKKGGRGDIRTHDYCFKEQMPMGEHCGEVQTREEFMKQLNKKGINLNKEDIQSSFKFKRALFEPKIDICNRFNNNGTCSNRCLYKSGNSIYDRHCNGGTIWKFEPVEDTSDRWRIKIGNKYIGKNLNGWKKNNDYWIWRTNYSLVAKSKANTFKILKHNKYIKLRDNYGGCLTKWKGRGKMNGIRGDNNCNNRGNYIRLKNNNNSYRC